jgi:nicotinic acid mononucleotide adenylyltransferase
MVSVFRRIPDHAYKIGLFSGGFNPPTNAHHSLLRAASRELDWVAFIIPRVYPHKEMTGAGLDDRIAMLSRLDPELEYSILIADQGLFIDIAREFRKDIRDQVELHFICGRDAAERIVSWDYGGGAGIAEQLKEYRLLVAGRQGEYESPRELRESIQNLNLEEGYDEVSSKLVRELLIQDPKDEGWTQLVPVSIVPLVRQIYSR